MREIAEVIGAGMNLPVESITTEEAPEYFGVFAKLEAPDDFVGFRSAYAPTFKVEPYRARFTNGPARKRLYRGLSSVKRIRATLGIRDGRAR
jgi:hypothetical protein